MLVLDTLYLAGGLALLLLGAEVVVRAATRLASFLRVPALLVGLTVVAYGTSAPELVVSLDAAIAGQPDLAVANVVGSNIFNVLAVLGLCAVIAPLPVSRALLRMDLPIMLFVSIALWAVSLDGRIGRLEGALLLVGFVAYTAFAFWRAKRNPAADVPGEPASVDAATRKSWPRVAMVVVRVIVGLGMLVVGARLTVEGAVATAEYLGISGAIIGLTIVAAGTSLPELVTSVVAGVRRQQDLAVGNVVGSNIFNILGIVGLSAVASGTPMEVAHPLVRYDMPVMIGVAVVAFPLLYTAGSVARWEGLLLLAYLMAYYAHLWLRAVEHAAARAFDIGLPVSMAAVTVVSLLSVGREALAGRARRGRRKRGDNPPR